MQMRRKRMFLWKMKKAMLMTVNNKKNPDGSSGFFVGQQIIAWLKTTNNLFCRDQIVRSQTVVATKKLFVVLDGKKRKN